MAQVKIHLSETGMLFMYYFVHINVISLMWSKPTGFKQVYETLEISSPYKPNDHGQDDH